MLVQVRVSRISVRPSTHSRTRIRFRTLSRLARGATVAVPNIHGPKRLSGRVLPACGFMANNQNGVWDAGVKQQTRGVEGAFFPMFSFQESG